MLKSGHHYLLRAEITPILSLCRGLLCLSTVYWMPSKALFKYYFSTKISQISQLGLISSPLFLYLNVLMVGT